MRNWGEATPTLTIDDAAVPRGERFRFGHVETLEGADLVCWIKAESTSTQHIRLVRGKQEDTAAPGHTQGE